METNNLQPTMTNEDVNKLQKFIEDNSNIINNFPDNPDEKGENRVINVSIDPKTGKEMITDTTAAEDTSVEFDKLLEESNIDFNIDESPITIDEIKACIDTCKDEPSILNELADQEIPISDLEILLNLIHKKQNKEEIESPYIQLPNSCKAIINKSLGFGSMRGETHYSKDLNATRNIITEAFLDEIISSTIMNRANTSINSGIEKLFDKATGEIGDTIVGYTEDRNNEYRKYIEENITDSNKKEDALKILDAIDHSYELKDFKEYCKTCRIRKIDVEKPLSIHNKDMDNIMNKYKDEPKYNIYNIYNAQTVLIRNINENDNYTDEQCRAFFIAFSKYCQNFKPYNTYEHIFMFYTLYNILLLDVNKGDKAEVSQKFLSNIKDCINSLITRNQFLSSEN